MMFDRPARRGTALADEGSLSVQASTIGLCRRVAEAKGIARCDGREVFSWIEAADEVASRVFAEVCDVIAVHIHNLQRALDPERVCLGGGVSRNPLFVEGVRAAHRRFNEGLSYAFPEAEIMPCRFFNDTNLIGAYQNFLARR